MREAADRRSADLKEFEERLGRECAERVGKEKATQLRLEAKLAAVTAESEEVDSYLQRGSGLGEGWGRGGG